MPLQFPSPILQDINVLQAQGILPTQDQTSKLQGLVSGAGKSKALLNAGYAASRIQLSSPLSVVAYGNSIVQSYGFFNEAAQTFYPTSILNWGIWTGGLCVKQTRLSGASTFYDRFGNLGHGGATLDSITSDITTSGMLTQYATDSFTPDVVCGVALLENDLGGGVSLATCISRVDSFVNTIRAIFPGTRIFLGTPLPSYSYDTTAKQAVAFSVADYIRSLELTNIDIFVVEQGVTYANSLYQPAAMIYVDDGLGTGNVHPTPMAAYLAGKAWGAKFQAVFGQPTIGRLSSTNPGLTGSIVATGGATGVTGTQPTGAGNFSTAVSAGAAISSVALQPGWQITFTRTALQGSDGFTFPSPSIGSIVPISTAYSDLYMRVKIISGGAMLAGIRPQIRVSYTDTTNGYIDPFSYRSTDVAINHGPIFLDGDELLFRLPRANAAATKTISSVTAYLEVRTRDVIGSVVLQVVAVGVVA